ncbi:MAG: hypothetical protein ACE5KE_04755 [Methanosarcinales archaeon]
MARIDISGKTTDPKDKVREAVIRSVKTRIQNINMQIFDIQKTIGGYEKKYGLKTEDFVINIQKVNLAMT